MAGIGKTTLAVIGRTRSSTFSDASFYLEPPWLRCRESPMSPDEALGTLLYSLGVPTQQLADSPDAQVGMYRACWPESAS